MGLGANFGSFDANGLGMEKWLGKDNADLIGQG
jgi:hypothetical protein